MTWMPARSVYAFLCAALRGRPKSTKPKKKKAGDRAKDMYSPSASTPTDIAGVPLPPPSIMFMKQTLDDAIRRGVINVDLVKASGGEVRDGLIFDIGCGYGRFAYGLLQTGFKGRYVGLDIVKFRIDWLDENFTSRQPRYTFSFIDVQNDHYNREGGQRETSYREALGGEYADTIVLFSVFTHMYLADIEAHLLRIAEVMSPSATLIFSCFLFDGIAQEGIKAGKAQRYFPYELSPDCRYDRAKGPLKAIAFTEAAMHRAMANAGLVGEVLRGNWSGAAPGFPGFPQDVVTARRSRSPSIAL
jgi:SAM-dependent methyltransferase